MNFLLSQCSDLVNAMIACSVCSKQQPRQLSKESEVVPQGSQHASDWQIILGRPVPLSKGSKCTLVCVDTVSGLSQPAITRD